MKKCWLLITAMLFCLIVTACSGNQASGGGRQRLRRNLNADKVIGTLGV